VGNYDGLDVSAEYLSARTVLNEHIKDPLLIEMLLCPLMYYGSAVENDMDFAQFAIMYKSIFHEGFCRPASGIKILLDLLVERFRECGGTILNKYEAIEDSTDASLAFNCGISRIHSSFGKVASIELLTGDILETDKILSSAGFAETMRIVDSKNSVEVAEGQLAFVETVALLDSALDLYSKYSSLSISNHLRLFANIVTRI